MSERPLNEDFELGLIGLCIEFYGESGDWFYDWDVGANGDNSVYIHLTVPSEREEESET